MSSYPRCLAHLLRHRSLEVLILQGSPLLGAILAADRLDAAVLPRVALLLLGSCLLVAQVFSFNDWSDAALDAGSPRKAGTAFLLQGIPRSRMLVLSAALGAAALAALAPLSGPVPIFGAAVMAAGLLYSAPRLGLKRIPVLSSGIHIAGQAAHFLMGYALVAPPDSRSLRLSLFFALAFTAGHLNQEVRDHDGDRENGVRTNAVVFGRRAAFAASGALFALSFASLAWLARRGDLPGPAAWISVLAVVYGAAFIAAMRSGLAFESVTRLQRIYRALFCAVGVSLVALQLGAVIARSAPPPPGDPFRMADRCPWFDPDALNFQWTLYMVSGKDTLVYVGFAPRLHDADGRAFAGVNLVVLEGNRESLNLWNRFPTSAARVGDVDLEVAIGDNRLARSADGDHVSYEVHLELEDGGRPITLDATVKRTTDPCRPGGFELLSWKETGNHFEYEVPCLKGTLSGMLTAGERPTRLSGLGYLESIRWLRSPLAKPARWFWGYAHSGEQSVLFFDPEGYPNARSLLLLSDGAECSAAVEGGGLHLEAPEGGDVRVSYEADDLSLTLRIDPSARSSSGFPIFLAPYRLELRRGDVSVEGRGAMVFEIGQWSTF